MTDKSNTPPEHKDCWQTPVDIFAALYSEFWFQLDAAASEHNALCNRYISEEQDTLKTSWKEMMIGGGNGYAWLNPPYSNPMPFVKKAAQENADNAVGCVMLLPADTSVGWFNEAIKTAHEVRLITGGRLAFINAGTGKPVSGNNKGSMLIIWHPWPRTHLQITTIDRDRLISYGKKQEERAA